ncbi:phospholipase D-like domain-containing protein [Mesoaciditoga sp.]
MGFLLSFKMSKLLTLAALFAFFASLSFSWSVYFTDPPHDGLLKSSFVNLISKAKYSIDLAIYNLSDEDVINLLKEKENDGVNVRIVMEGKNYVDNIQSLKALNVTADPVEGGLMHDRFAIIDDEYVWFGSANLTHSSFYNDLNNAVIFHSFKLANAFKAVFDSMFKGFFASEKSEFATSLSAENVKVDIIFSPEGGIFKKVIDELKGARKDVYVAMYAFSDVRIALTLMLLEERGVKIHVIADSSWNSSKYSVVNKMHEFGFKMYENPYGLLHDKYVIIDPCESDAKVITGSYNFTHSAQSKNDEFIVVLHSKKIAQLYLKNFELLIGKKRLK